ncbi:hypothetical protein C8J56DRAFT_974340 [Mycena floridula]|nr:hypothetical protein C8J56DRAFT_974340 [Mycena floridula]
MLPKYIYKLVPSKLPLQEPLPVALPLSDLDERDGFIHTSTAAQVPGTLKRFFSDPAALTTAAGPSGIYVLRIPYEPVKEKIKWEDPSGARGEPGSEGVFPHIYEGKLGKEEVESVSFLEMKDDRWDEALDKVKEWLI